MSVRERPILFSGPMVRAILAGKKTQTRRVVTGFEICPGKDGLFDVYRLKGPGAGWCGAFKPGDSAGSSGALHCPYGVRGERLWVRETFRQGDGSMSVHYAADPDEVSGGPWRPSIFMPRWASRLTLEITEVRVQRLQEIDDQAAIAEGIGEFVPPENRAEGLTRGALCLAAAHAVAAMPRQSRRTFLDSALAASLGFVASRNVPGLVAGGWRGFKRAPTPRELFSIAWDVINGKRAPWAANPWVWAITFRRVA